MRRDLHFVNPRKKTDRHLVILQSRYFKIQFQHGDPIQLLGAAIESEILQNLPACHEAQWDGILKTEESPERATYRSFLCLAVHVAQRGKKAKAHGASRRTTSLTAAIFSVPAKDYQHHNATVPRANGSHLAVQMQGDAIPREQRAEDYEAHQPSHGPLLPMTGLALESLPAPRILRAQDGRAGSGSGAEEVLGSTPPRPSMRTVPVRRRKLTVLRNKCVLAFSRCDHGGVLTEPLI
ncbi:protein JTB isoform X1 [Kogia breviceps]|uniref:protein JTB isoform X1 n=1 Tax=Kogia breviceps TaxID=27615 RepID=UPI0034D24B66